MFSLIVCLIALVSLISWINFSTLSLHHEKCNQIKCINDLKEFWKNRKMVLWCKLSNQQTLYEMRIVFLHFSLLSVEGTLLEHAFLIGLKDIHTHIDWLITILKFVSLVVLFNFEDGFIHFLATWLDGLSLLAFCVTVCMGYAWRCSPFFEFVMPVHYR